MDLKIDKKTFDGIIYAAAGYSDNVYKAMVPEIHNSEAALDVILQEQGKAALENNDILLVGCQEHVCASAFLNRLRHFDLILTDAGFGVVSDDHTAPASRERVNALEAQLKRKREESYCNILRELIKVPGWGANAAVRRYFPTLLWDIVEAEDMTGNKDLSAEDWGKLKSRLFDASFKIEGATGHVFQEELIAATITDSVRDIQAEAIARVKNTMVMIVNHQEEKHIAKEAVRRLVEWLESVGENFPSYTNSKEYAARHAGTYKNKEESPVYFFG